MPNTRGIRAGRAFVELGVNDRLTRGLRRAQRQLRAFAGVPADQRGTGLVQHLHGARHELGQVILDLALDAVG